MLTEHGFLSYGDQWMERNNYYKHQTPFSSLETELNNWISSNDSKTTWWKIENIGHKAARIVPHEVERTIFLLPGRKDGDKRE